MATSKKTAAVYVWDAYPDDPTLGGAIPAELFEQLQASAEPSPPEPAESPPPS